MLPGLALAASAILAGSLVYCVLTVIAALRYRAVKTSPLQPAQPISVLTPLAGLDLSLERNLRSLFTQDYPDYELVFAVREESDPAVPVVRALMAKFPSVPARLLVPGEPDCPNAKVYSLKHLIAASHHELLVMIDSDVRGGADMLRVFAAEFQNSAVGLATCPYRAVPGRSFWSKLEAIGMNTQFIGGVLVARMLEGMRFALGPCIVARRAALEGIGGMDRVDSYLAEDFVLGKLAHEAGFEVILSSYVVEHHIGSAGFRANMAHRLRWVRSTRRSRPKGYIGELFTNPLPIALAVWALNPAWWPSAAVAVLFRAASAGATAGLVLRDRLTLVYWWALPLQDLIGFVVWLLGFYGKHIVWRGRTYYLHRDGRFEPVR